MLDHSPLSKTTAEVRHSVDLRAIRGRCSLVCGYKAWGERRPATTIAVAPESVSFLCNIASYTFSLYRQEVSQSPYRPKLQWPSQNHLIPKYQSSLPTPFLHTNDLTVVYFVVSWIFKLFDSQKHSTGVEIALSAYLDKPQH